MTCTPNGPAQPRLRIFPGLEDAAEWDAAGKGERQAKELESDGE